MRNFDGTYYVTADELRAFRDSGREYWYMNEDGSTDVHLDDQLPLDGTLRWPLYLMNNSEAWFRQWNGDYETAVNEQLNPVLQKNLAG